MLKLFRTKRKGFSLLEAVVTMGFIATVSASTTMLTTNLVKSNVMTQDQAVLTNIAQNKATVLRNTPYASATPETRHTSGSSNYDIETILTSNTTQVLNGVTQSVASFNVNVYHTSDFLPAFTLPIQVATSNPPTMPAYADYLRPISGNSQWKLAYSADGSEDYSGTWGRIVMKYDVDGKKYGVQVDNSDMVGGMHPNSASVGNTIVNRDVNGSFIANSVSAQIFQSQWFDFVLGIGDQVSRGNSGNSRALVKDLGSTLVINYSNDFSGGVRVDSGMSVSGIIYSGGNRVLTTADVPSSIVSYFQLSSCPSGWLLANGQPGTYDLRGEFIRGADLGRGADVDWVGRGVGTWKADQFKSHQHLFGGDDMIGWSPFSYTAVSYVGYDAQSSMSGGGANYRTKSDPSSPGGSETRPRNVALLPCVKQ